MLHAPSQHPYEEIQYLGLVIAKTGVDQRHVGIIYKTDDTPVQFCHLAWHHRLIIKDDPRRDPNIIYYWVDPIDLEDDDKKYIASWLESSLQDANVPYGFDPSNSSFQMDGTFIHPPIGKGFTCATFVDALLRSLGYSLLNTATWSERDDDIPWQQKIIAWLRLNGASAEHVAALENDLGFVRIRPEDVIASACCSPWPVAFETMSPIAQAIRQEITSL